MLSVYFQIDKPDRLKSCLMRTIVSQGCACGQGYGDTDEQMQAKLNKLVFEWIDKKEEPGMNRTLPSAPPKAAELRQELPRVEQEVLAYARVESSALTKDIIQTIDRELQEVEDAPHYDEWSREWHSYDDAEKEDPAQPWSRLASEAMFAVQIVKDLYAKVLAEEKALLIESNVKFKPKKERRVAWGSTDIVMDQTSLHVADKPVFRRAEVLLELPESPLRTNSYLIPYVVAHEFGVHVFEQLDDLALATTSDVECCHYSEGFMDLVIKEALDRELCDRHTARHDEYRRAGDLRYMDRADDVPNGYEDELLRENWILRMRDGQQAWAPLVKMGEELATGSEEMPEDDPAHVVHLQGKAWAEAVACKLNTLTLTPLERSALLFTLQDLAARDPFEHARKNAEIGVGDGESLNIFSALCAMLGEPNRLRAVERLRQVLMASEYFTGRFQRLQGER